MRLLLLLAPLFGGCLAHHPLVLDELPAPTAPLLERAVAYERVKPSPLLRATPPVPSVILANGILINDPMELAPLVPAEGPTMKHAKAARDLDELAMWIGGAGIGVGVLGIAGEIAGGVLAYSPGDSVSQDAGLAIAIGSAVVAATGLLAAAAPVIYVGMEAIDEREVAFATFEPDLRARLALVPK